MSVQNRGKWTEVLVLSLASIFLYHVGIGTGIGVGFLLFLVPLQVLHVRRGAPAALGGMALFLAAAAAARAILRTMESGGGGWAPFLSIEFFSLGTLMAGLLLVNRTLFPRVARVNRLLGAAALTGLLSIPLLLYLWNNQAFLSGARRMFEELLQTLNAGGLVPGGLELPLPLPPPSGPEAAPPAALTADTLMRLIGGIFIRSYLFDYFLLLVGSWWLGSQIGARSLGRPAGITRLVDFHLPDWAIWPLIGGLALVVLDIFGGRTGAAAGGRTLPDAPGAAAIVGWNAALIFLFLFGLAGIGILRHLFQAFRVPRGLRLLIVLGLVALILSPRISLIFLLLIPGLGISEIWIKFRRLGRSEDST